MRAYGRRKQYEARLIVIEFGRALGSGKRSGLGPAEVKPEQFLAIFGQTV